MSLLEDVWEPFWKEARQYVWGGLMLFGGTILMLALLTYSSSDPSLNTASTVAAHNWMGEVGAFTADLFWQTLGLSALFLPLALLNWGWRMARWGQVPWWQLKLPALVLALMTGAMSFGTWPLMLWGHAPLGIPAGGAIGAILYNALPAALAWKIIILTLTHVITAGLCLAVFAIAPWKLWRALADHVEALIAVFTHTVPKLRAHEDEEKDEEEEEAEYEEDEETDGEEDEEEQPRRRAARVNVPAAKAAKKTKARRARELPEVGEENFELPPLELLTDAPESRGTKISKDALARNAEMLMNVLEEFGINGEITEVHPGPVVTLYELQPAPGIKSSRVISLADDIARSMSATAARVAVVPGRNVIGIELPNANRETVWLRELLETDSYQNHTLKLPLVLGKDIGGGPIIADLSKMPHLLVAGTTGSGKSVAVNAMILSLLYCMTPEQCRLIMIDPKMLELSIYDEIPHLLTPVVTDPKKAIVALKWTVREMEDRYRAMSKLGVRNLEGYNQRLAEARKTGETLSRKVQTGFDPDTGKPVFEEQPVDLAALPHIVVVVDEFADLMLVAGKEIEGAIQRLAQMARAAGIHLIMATQRPSVDVITGTIKANFPTRISFQVTSKIDSRTILGEGGAEQLLGQGDMLYMAAGGRLSRVHGPFVKDQEVEKIVEFLKSQGAPEYIEAILEDPEEEGEEGEEESGEEAVDPMFDKAVAVVAREGKASTSFIQRHLSIGYNRAARIVEAMERQGMISPANATGKREIYLRQAS